MATGNWTLSIRDGVGVDIGRFSSWSLRVYGTVAIPEPATWLLASIGALALGRSTRHRELAIATRTHFNFNSRRATPSVPA